MKPGQLFEAALKEAGLELKSGAEIKIKVKRHRGHLKLVISSADPTDFEAEILARSLRTSESMVTYRPSLTPGETIRALRKSAGMTLEALAGRADMSKGSLCSVETGERRVGLAVLRKIAKALGVPVGLLAK